MIFNLTDAFQATGYAHHSARWPDVVVFVNGLAVVALKNPANASADVWRAYSQLQTYQDEISDLMAYKVALVICDGITARVGSTDGQ